MNLLSQPGNILLNFIDYLFSWIIKLTTMTEKKAFNTMKMNVEARSNPNFLVLLILINQLHKCWIPANRITKAVVAISVAILF